MRQPLFIPSDDGKNPMPGLRGGGGLWDRTWRIFGGCAGYRSAAVKNWGRRGSGKDGCTLKSCDYRRRFWLDLIYRSLFQTGAGQVADIWWKQSLAFALNFHRILPEFFRDFKRKQRNFKGSWEKCSETTEKTSVKLCKIDRTDAKDRKSSKNLRIDKKREFR